MTTECNRGLTLRQQWQSLTNEDHNDQAYNVAVDDWIRHCKNCKNCREAIVERTQPKGQTV